MILRWFDGRNVCPKKTHGLAPLLLIALFTGCSAFAVAQDSAPAQNPPPGTVTGFTINVQVITKSEFAGGGVGLQHQRSYNDEHGIDIPVTISSDGTFQGSGSGSNSGTADLTARGINGDSKFGNTLSIFASGTIIPGDCSAIPCTPGTMHLTLSGITSQQNANAHVRAGNMNRSYGNVTPGGSGTFIADLPAVLGGKVEQVLFSNTITTSIMLITITDQTVVPADDPKKPPVPQRPPGLPLGPPDGGGDDGGSNSGGAGTGSHGSGGGSSSGPGAGSGSSAVGVVIPGLENGIPPTKLPVIIHVEETIHTADAMPANLGPAPVNIAINETIHTRDAVQPPVNNVVVVVNESIHATDVIPSSLSSSAVNINVNENISASDAVQSSANVLTINVGESVHVADKN